MMERGFVPGDQSLAHEGSQSEFWCIKPPPLYSLLVATYPAGPAPPAAEFCPGMQTPIKLCTA